MTIYRLGDRRTRLETDAFVAPGAVLIGAVIVGRDASVWFGTVIRADNEVITIGEETNIQDNCVLHADPGIPLQIGCGVTVGHGAILHGCVIGDHSLIGMGSVVSNRARIGSHCLVGARSLVTEGQEIPDRSLVMGSPARVIRPVTEAQMESIRRSAAKYVAQGSRYRADLRPA